MIEIKAGYYYEHQNGRIIFKNAVVVDMDPHYFDSPFVKRVWRIRDPSNPPADLVEKLEAQEDDGS